MRDETLGVGVAAQCCCSDTGYGCFAIKISARNSSSAVTICENYPTHLKDSSDISCMNETKIAHTQLIDIKGILAGNHFVSTWKVTRLRVTIFLLKKQAV
jgi:hypothetical protein